MAQLLAKIGRRLGVLRLLQQFLIVNADGQPRQIVLVDHRLPHAVDLGYKDIGADIDCLLPRLKGLSGPRLQRSDLLFGGTHFPLTDSQRPGDGAVLLAAQLGKIVFHDGQHRFVRLAAAPQLQDQALTQIPGRHTGRFQALYHCQSLGDHLRRDLHLPQTLQVLRQKVSILIHQTGKVFAQGQKWFAQTPSLQLIAQKSTQTFQFPVHPATLHRLGRRGHPAVQPADPASQLFVFASQNRRLFPFQHGVFIDSTVHILQKLLGIHLQHFHRLQHLGCQVLLLTQLMAYMQLYFIRHQATPPPCFSLSIA